MFSVQNDLCGNLIWRVFFPYFSPFLKIPCCFAVTEQRCLSHGFLRSNLGKPSFISEDGEGGERGFPVNFPLRLKDDDEDVPNTGRIQ